MRQYNLNYLFLQFKSYWIYLTKILFNKVAREQLKNPKSIPIIIINFNQLYYLKQQINVLIGNGYFNIIIIDNKSSYPPLLKYYKEIEASVKIIYMEENFGHMVFWNKIEKFKEYIKGFYVITDADIVPIKECPDNFMKTFVDISIKYKDITKVGFSLKIDDIPDVNKNKEKIINWESKFWKNEFKDGYFASIDTTFALYRPYYISPKNKNRFLNGIRLKYPYIAKHGGWYINHENLTDEQKYYLKTCNQSSSWRSDENGKLITTDYNR